MNHDVFNGDADGICALHQLRLAFPATNNLVTGTKRDIDLLRCVEAGPGDEVTVLDLALSKNREALLALLGKGDRKSTRLNSSHSQISYAVFCLKKKKKLH